jgi:hypothetical protein
MLHVRYSVLEIEEIQYQSSRSGCILVFLKLLNKDRCMCEVPLLELDGSTRSTYWILFRRELWKSCLAIVFLGSIFRDKSLIQVS